jgi:hypothetical protein
MTQRGQWPAGANDVPTQTIHTCSCGARSTSPIRHDHSRRPAPKPSRK